MGSKSSKNNSPFIEEDEKETIYELDEFDEILKKIDLLKEIETNRQFYKELNVKNELLDTISKKYFRFKGIKRFCIPIIGVISSGKSAFMNYLLQLNNILQIGEKVTTQFNV